MRTMISGKVVVPIVVVVVAAVVVLLLVNRDDTRAAAGSPTPSHSPERLTSAEASRLADEVTSGDEKRVRAAVAVSSEQPLDAEAVSGLATIRMTLDVRTFHDLGHGAAEVIARVVPPGGAPPTEWTVRLVAVDRKWLISSTEPVQ